VKNSCVGDLLAVGAEFSIPNMGEALEPYFQNVTSVVISIQAISFRKSSRKRLQTSLCHFSRRLAASVSGGSNASLRRLTKHGRFLDLI
jgi:hypothetical protein